jgi:hypothetical protein
MRPPKHRTKINKVTRTSAVYPLAVNEEDLSRYLKAAWPGDPRLTEKIDWDLFAFRLEEAWSGHYRLIEQSLYNRWATDIQAGRYALKAVSEETLGTSGSRGHGRRGRRPV